MDLKTKLVCNFLREGKMRRTEERIHHERLSETDIESAPGTQQPLYVTAFLDVHWGFFKDNKWKKQQEWYGSFEHGDRGIVVSFNSFPIHTLQ